MGTPLQVVTLYANADHEAFQAYENNLAGLLRNKTIKHFHQGTVEAGEQRSRLDAALREADVVLCLLSADFLANRELMDRAERVAADPRVTLVPVRLRQAALVGTVFARLQTLPSDGGICTDQDQAFTEVAETLRRYAAGPRVDGPDALRGAPRAHDDLLSRVERVCVLKEERAGRSARIRRRPGPTPYETILEVSYQERFLERQFLIAVLQHTPQTEEVKPLAKLLQKQYRPFNDLVHAELIHLGMVADGDTQREAGLARVELLPLADYQGLINFERYVNDQTRRLEEDPLYPPSLYVPQRMVFSRGIGGREAEAADDALTTLLGWVADLNAPRFALVLGDFGVGKTFLLHELARRLAETEIVPVLLELRSLEKAHSLEVLLSQHLAKAGMQRIDLAAFRYLLEEGRIALLFDGFDELALRVSYDRAIEHLDTVAQAVRGKAKVVLTSRTQHFRTDEQVKTALARHIEALPGHHAVRLLPFDDGQILAFLEKQLGSAAQAAERFRLVEEVKDLLGLSHNPRMLSFIAKLPEERLRAAQARGEVTAA